MGIARAPFEVVEQGPHEVAAHVGAGGDGRTQGSDVEGEIADALQVDEVARAVELLDGTGTVLKDVDRQAIAPIQLDQVSRNAAGWICQPILVFGTSSGASAQAKPSTARSSALA